MARLLEAPHAGGKLFNIGSGRGVRISEVVETLLRVSGSSEAHVAYTSGGPVSAASRVLNCERLCRELGWVPPTSLKEGLRATLRWWQAPRTTWRR